MKRAGAGNCDDRLYDLGFPEKRCIGFVSMIDCAIYFEVPAECVLIDREDLSAPSMHTSLTAVIESSEAMLVARLINDRPGDDGVHAYLLQVEEQLWGQGAPEFIVVEGHEFSVQREVWVASTLLERHNLIVERDRDHGSSAYYCWGHECRLYVTFFYEASYLVSLGEGISTMSFEPIYYKAVDPLYHHLLEVAELRAEQ